MVVIPALANIVLNYFIVPAYGMIGAAVTTVVCFIFVILLTYLLANHWYPVKYAWKRIWSVWGLGIAIFILSLLVSHDQVWISVGLKISLLVGFTALLYLFKLFNLMELKQIKRIIFKK